MVKNIFLDYSTLGLIVYLSQRQWHDKNLILRSDWLLELMQECKPADLPRVIADKAFNSLRPSERKAIVLWGCKQIPMSTNDREFLIANSFINGKTNSVTSHVQKKCEDAIVLYEK